jgi:hypothetical protein
MGKKVEVRPNAQPCLTKSDENRKHSDGIRRKVVEGETIVVKNAAEERTQRKIETATEMMPESHHLAIKRVRLRLPRDEPATPASLDRHVAVGHQLI